DHAGRQTNRVGPEALVAERFKTKHGLAIGSVAKRMRGRRTGVGRTRRQVGGRRATVVGAPAAGENPHHADGSQAYEDAAFARAVRTHIDSFVIEGV
ncbi:MAG: hypothetical protein H0W34_08050, partial [Pyrinomonadaceae bacterium]|nr:hypothetical protein [Pyrinomonadaceae bacterium]